MRWTFATLTVLIALAWAGCDVAAGDVFVLTNGGRVIGELINPDQVPRKTFVIKTPTGVQVTLLRSQVKQRLRPRRAELEYEKIRPRYPDTIEGQWALAEWCRENTLLSQRKVHLERILELDPDHEKARRALGYVRQDGQWTTEAQQRKRGGYVRYRGRWRLTQEVKLMREREDVKAAEGSWRKKLNQWREWIGGNRTLLALQNIQRIDDPFAVPALEAALAEESARDNVRLAMITALAQIGTPAANKVLAFRAMADPIPEVRLTCLDHLKREKSPEVVEFFVDGLRSNSNEEVNRAAIGLRQMGDSSAVGPLIDSLITLHKQKISGGNPGQITTGFGTGGGGSPGGLSVGNRGPKIVTYFRHNQAVLDALVALTNGVNYGFNVDLWKAWYAAQRRSHQVDARRD